jgi:hypothetical protein
MRHDIDGRSQSVAEGVRLIERPAARGASRPPAVFVGGLLVARHGHLSGLRQKMFMSDA